MLQFISFYLDTPLQQGRAYDIFSPENFSQEKAVFFVHGGGWRAGNRSEHFHRLMEELCRLGYICATTDYRLKAPDAFAQLQDIRESYAHFSRWLKEHYRRAVPIYVFGSSAGAHLASLLCAAKPGECGEAVSDEIAENWQIPAGMMLQATPTSFLPWEDIFPGIWTVMQNIAGCSLEAHPEKYRALSFETYLRPGMPDLFFLEAENEHMFPIERNRAFLEKGRSMGLRICQKVYPRCEHGFLYDLTRRQQKEAFQDMIAFMNGENPES